MEQKHGGHCLVVQRETNELDNVYVYGILMWHHEGVLGVFHWSRGHFRVGLPTQGIGGLDIRAS